MANKVRQRHRARAERPAAKAGAPGRHLHRMAQDYKPAGRTADFALVVVEGILDATKHGCKWRGLPARFGNWHTIYTPIESLGRGPSPRSPVPPLQGLSANLQPSRQTRHHVQGIFEFRPRHRALGSFHAPQCPFRDVDHLRGNLSPDGRGTVKPAAASPAMRGLDPRRYPGGSGSPVHGRRREPRDSPRSRQWWSAG